VFHIWYTIWYGITFPDVCCTCLCYRCTVCFALIKHPCILKYFAHFLSRGFSFDPMMTSMYTLNNSMYPLFYTFPPFLTFKHCISSFPCTCYINTYYYVQLANCRIAIHISSRPLLSWFLFFSVAAYPLFTLGRTCLWMDIPGIVYRPHVSGWRHAARLRITGSVDRHGSGWRHVSPCTFPVLCTNSMSLDGGTLSICALPLVWKDMALNGGTLSTCAFPEPRYGSTQYPVHVLV